MIAMIIFGLFALAMAAFAIVCVCLWQAAQRHGSDEPLWREEPEVDLVVSHTYKPYSSRIPLRGRLVAQAAYAQAKRLRAPLVMGVGHTVPGEPRMECEIYRDWVVVHFFDSAQPIITGADGAVRDTAGEVPEIYRLAREMGARRILVVGLRPHLFRIINYWNYWRRIGQPRLDVVFLGIYGPWQYYLWEAAMFFFELALPPGSKRRTWVLNAAKRRG